MGREQQNRPLAIRVLIAMAIVTAAMALRVWLMPLDARPAFVTFSPAMILCFLLCGTGPGVAATLLSAALTYTVIIPPCWSFAFKPTGAIITAVFILSSLGIGYLVSNIRRREQSVRRRAIKQLAMFDSELLGAATVRFGRITWGNRGLEKLLDYPAGELVGLAPRAGYADDTAYAAITAAAAPIISTGGTYRSEVVMMTKQGAPIWVDLTGKILDPATGETLWLFSDITARKQAEQVAAEASAQLAEALATAQESAARFRLLAENARDMIATMAPDSTILFVTQAVQRILGYTPEDMVGRRTLSLTHPDDIPTSIAFFNDLIAAGPNAPTRTYEFRARRRDGSWVWLEGQPRVEFDAEGLPLYFQDIVRDIDARKQAEAALRTSQSFLARTSQVAGIGGWEYDLVTSTMTWSDETCRLHDEPAGHSPTLEQGIAYYAPEARPVIAKAVQDGIDSGLSWDLELPIASAKGRAFWARAVGIVECEGGRPVRLVGAFQDVTRMRQMAHDLAESHELLQVTLKSIGDAVITTDAAGIVTWLNAAAERLTGWWDDDAKGVAVTALFAVIDEDTRLSADNPVGACLAAGHSQAIAPRTLMVARDGTEYGIEGSASALHDDTHTLLGAVLVFHDVSEHRRHGREMTYRATHDPLTGLANRAEFESRLGRLLTRTDAAPTRHALLFIDLDEFKQVNDSCGHAAGDALLRRIGALFEENIGPRGSVARLGGDEFGIILEDCDPAEAATAAQSLCQQVDSFRFPYERRRFRVGSSIGMVPFDRRWTSTAAVIKAADTACYAAKEAGRNRVHIWDAPSPEADTQTMLCEAH